MPDPGASPDAAITLTDAEQWEAWLAKHHADSDGVWLRIAKKGSGATSLTAAEGTEVALCFGWIDGHRKSYDSSWFLQRYSPRRRRSTWSRINVDRAEALIGAGRMRAAGLAEIERAKTDGRWDAAYASQASAVVPGDLATALASDDAARATFEAMGRTDRYAVILTLLKARTPVSRETQLRRAIAELRG
jgi:uncharacterized protein YdeI (YjbR/CyaY-like superfamily)